MQDLINWPWLATRLITDKNLARIKLRPSVSLSMLWSFLIPIYLFSYIGWNQFGNHKRLKKYEIRNCSRSLPGISKQWWCCWLLILVWVECIICGWFITTTLHRSTLLILVWVYHLRLVITNSCIIWSKPVISLQERSASNHCVQNTFEECRVECTRYTVPLCVLHSVVDTCDNMPTVLL